MKNRFFRKSKTILPFCFWAAILMAFAACLQQGNNKAPTYSEYLNEEFERLVSIRENRTARVLSWLNDQQALVEKKETVEQLSDRFLKMRSILARHEDKEAFLRLNDELERFFVYGLGSFYDLLFINKNGIIFYSMKLENDFNTSLMDGRYSNTSLAKLIKDLPWNLTFVDFEYYEASDEPAAFYVLPVIQDGTLQGWIALQLSINSLNRLLTQRNGLGRTGEAYLVNDQHLMLTESRFLSEDTVLSKKIDTEAVKSRKGETGNGLIEDYRGIRVLSTFQSFQAGTAHWRIIVEKDEDEVITGYYDTYRRALLPLLISAIEKTSASLLEPSKNFKLANDNAKRVDVGELIKADERKSLYTSGIATCTGFLAYMDQNSLAYMAHLSPTDACYDLSEKEAALLGNSGSDLIGLMMRRIQFLEIKPYQVRDLRFVIAAPHSRSHDKIIAKLMNDGVMLSQIKSCIVPAAMNTALYADLSNHTITAQWHINTIEQPMALNIHGLPALSSLIKTLIP